MKRSILALLASVALAATACSARPGTYEEDFTEVVEDICSDYCSMNLMCREPPAFDTRQKCEDTCLGYAYIYNDTTCGEAMREMFQCIASTQTCEAFNDTYNVHAEDYTCKSEKDRWVGLSCGESDEDPFPPEAP